MQYELVTTQEGLVSLETEWRELEERSSAGLFQSYGFAASWYACAGMASRAVPAVAVCREYSVVRAIFPGCVIRKGGVKFLTWLGGFFAVDYGDVLFDPMASCGVESFLSDVLTLLREKTGFHLCYLNNVRHDSPAYPYFKQHLREFRGDVAPYVELSGSFDTYLDSLKRFRKKQKSDTLRQIKRLSELGQLEFSIISGYDARASELLEAFFKQKNWRFRTSGVHGVLLMPGYEEFYRDQALHNDTVHLSCITLDGQIIATHVGYLYKQRFYYLMPAYDHHYGTYSPGRVLAYYLIRDCFEQGVDVFDFSIGSEEYKYEWTRDEVAITSFVSDTLPGRLFTAIKKGKIQATAYLRSLKGMKK